MFLGSNGGSGRYGNPGMVGYGSGGGYVGNAGGYNSNAGGGPWQSSGTPQGWGNNNPAWGNQGGGGDGWGNSQQTSVLIYFKYNLL